MFTSTYEVEPVDPHHRTPPSAKSTRAAARERQAQRKAAVRAWKAQRRRVIYQGRRMVRPVVWLCVLQAGAWLCGLPPYGWAISAGLSTLIGWLMLNARRVSPGPALLAWAWLLLASWLGPFGLRALLLWAVGTALAVPYWHRHHTSLQPAAAAEMETADAESVKLTAEQKVWQDRVAAKGMPLAGTELETPVAVPGGWSARVRGVPGTHDLDVFIGRLVKIASAYEVSRDQVSIEATDTRAEHEVQLTVLRGVENLDQVRYIEDHPETAIDADGIAQVGFFGDMRPTRIQFFTIEGGVRFALVAGGTGSGKSRFVEGLMARVHRDPRGVNILIDAQGGQSQPDWNGRVHRTALGIEGGLYELRRLDWQLRRRAELFGDIEWTDEHGRARRGWTHLVPNERYPMMQVILEEAPLLFDDEEAGEEAAELIASGAKTWRKAGGRLVIVTQLPSVEELKKQSIRSMLRSNGDVISFRTGDSVSQNMLGMQNDPSKLPEHFSPSGNHTKGLGYIVGIDRRQAMWRAMIPRDPYGIALEPPAGVLDAFTVRAGEEFDANPEAPGRPPKPKMSEREAAELAGAVLHLMVQAGRVLPYAELWKVVSAHVPGGVTMPQLDAALTLLTKQGRVLPSADGSYVPLVDGHLPTT
ncbi:hypothetical protein [Nonomuraea dietziae]|uniref:hypothetical protein n=1 Tax=Nonomuraea dietziae TaxID=65515 RepID=UPI00342B36F8